MDSLLLIKLFTVRLGLGVVMPIVAVCPPSGGEELMLVLRAKEVYCRTISFALRLLSPHLGSGWGLASLLLSQGPAVTPGGRHNIPL